MLSRINIYEEKGEEGEVSRRRSRSGTQVRQSLGGSSGVAVACQSAQQLAEMAVPVCFHLIR